MRTAICVGVGLLVSVVLSGCTRESAPPPPVQAPSPPPTAARPSAPGKTAKAGPAAKRVVLIIGHHNFRDEEYEKPREALTAAGIEVTVASSSLEPATGMLGATVQPDVLLPDVKAQEYDAVVFIGGTGAEEYWDDPTAQQLCQDTVSQGKLLAAICLAPVTLARAGVLKGKAATVWPDEKGEVVKRGGTYEARRVVVDGKLITGSGPEAAQEFATALVKALTS